MTVERSSFTANSASNHGGAIAGVSSASPTHDIVVRDSTFTRNRQTGTSALNGGGAIAIEAGGLGSLHISGSSFDGNSGFTGGAVQGREVASVENSTFYSNSATAGNALMVVSPTVQFVLLNTLLVGASDQCATAAGASIVVTNSPATDASCGATQIDDAVMGACRSGRWARSARL